MSRRMEILRRAAEVFERKGVARTSMEDIANAVGIKREGVYYYFKSRGDILLEVILPQSNSLLLNLQSILRSKVSAGEKLHEAVRSHLDSFNPAYLEMSVALREDHFVRDDAKLAELQKCWDDYSHCWVDLIVAGQKEGVFNEELNPKMAAYGLLGMMNWVCRWYDPDGEVSIPEIIQQFSAMAANGLTGK